MTGTIGCPHWVLPWCQCNTYINFISINNPRGCESGSLLSYRCSNLVSPVLPWSEFCFSRFNCPVVHVLTTVLTVSCMLNSQCRNHKWWLMFSKNTRFFKKYIYSKSGFKKIKLEGHEVWRTDEYYSLQRLSAISRLSDFLNLLSVPPQKSGGVSEVIPTSEDLPIIAPCCCC